MITGGFPACFFCNVKILCKLCEIGTEKLTNDIYKCYNLNAGNGK